MAACSGSGVPGTNGGSSPGVAGTTGLIPVDLEDGGVASGGSSSGGACGSVEVGARAETTEKSVDVPGNVLFVFDQSSSMLEAWENKPKWQAANDALVAGFAELQNKLRAGAILFPTASATGVRGGRGGFDQGRGLESCPEVAPITSTPQMPMQEGAAFLGAWKAYWQGGESVLQVGTPTELALTRAEAALATPPAGNTAVVLLTDGQPNCGSNEAAIAARLLQKNIKTYVVGLPGARDGITVLDAIAKAGGTAPAGCRSDCFLSPANPTDLQAALANIASTTVSQTTVQAIKDCEFVLTPPKNADPADVHLIATDSRDGKRYEVPQTPSNGWTLSADNKIAKLEGPICEAAKAGNFSSFSFQYGCVSVPPLNVR